MQDATSLAPNAIDLPADPPIIDSPDTPVNNTTSVAPKHDLDASQDPIPIKIVYVNDASTRPQIDTTADPR
jgi:hypothetical protein